MYLFRSVLVQARSMLGSLLFPGCILVLRLLFWTAIFYSIFCLYRSALQKFNFVVCHSMCKAFLILLWILLHKFHLRTETKWLSDGCISGAGIRIALLYLEYPLKMLRIQSLALLHTGMQVHSYPNCSLKVFFLLIVLSNVKCCRLLLTAQLLYTLISWIHSFQLKYMPLSFKRSEAVMHACHNLNNCVKLVRSKIDRAVRVQLVLRKSSHSIHP